VDGADDLGVLRIPLDALAQLGDVLVQGAAVGQVVHAPAFVEQGIAVQHPPRVGAQQGEQLDVPQAEVDGLGAAVGPQLLGMDLEVADSKRRLVLGRAARVRRVMARMRAMTSRTPKGLVM